MPKKKVGRKYVTIKRGKVKIPVGSKQHKFLLAHDLKHSVVKVGKGGKKSVKRVGTRTKTPKGAIKTKGKK